MVKEQQWLFVFTHCGLLWAVLFGKWTDHVKSWRSTDLGDRIMYITYEEMVQVKHSHGLLLAFRNNKNGGIKCLVGRIVKQMVCWIPRAVNR